MFFFFKMGTIRAFCMAIGIIQTEGDIYDAGDERKGI